VQVLPGQHVMRAGKSVRHADQRVDQRRLAGAVAAQQRQRAAGFEREDTSLKTTASP
jgi:hypothetical protein